jgi:hypothetical protein
MYRSIRIAPPNSIIFVSDPDGGEAPEPIWGAMILFTSSCISVGCFPEIDGETEITLGPIAEVGTGELPAFTGTLETPSYAVVVSTVEKETILKVPVSKTKTEVRIWLSHPRWPEKVIIGLG